jgi:hypothetical protein
LNDRKSPCRRWSGEQNSFARATAHARQHSTHGQCGLQSFDIAPSPTTPRWAPTSECSRLADWNPELSAKVSSQVGTCRPLIARHSLVTLKMGMSRRPEKTKRVCRNICQKGASTRDTPGHLAGEKGGGPDGDCLCVIQPVADLRPRALPVGHLDSHDQRGGWARAWVDWSGYGGDIHSNMIL